LNIVIPFILVFNFETLLCLSSSLLLLYFLLNIVIFFILVFNFGTACEAVRGVHFNNDMGNTVVKKDGSLRLFMIGSRAEDDEKKHKLLELFPLQPEEDEKKHQLLKLFPLRPSGNSYNSYNLLQHLQFARNDTICEAVHAVRFSNDIGGSLLPFTECTLCPRECNIMIGSQAKEDEKKHQLLELFPLRPNGNHKSC
jgi:hypothetical protein